MASVKYDIPLLDCSIRFSLWQVKLRVVLAHMELDDAILGVDHMSASLKDDEKKRREHKALI